MVFAQSADFGAHDGNFRVVGLLGIFNGKADPLPGPPEV